MPSGSEGPDEVRLVLAQFSFSLTAGISKTGTHRQENQNLPLQTSFPHLVHAAQNKLLDVGQNGASLPTPGYLPAL